MQLSEFTLRIILLFIPGIISTLIIDRLTFHKELKMHNKFISSLLLGFLCYSFYYLIILVVGYVFKINLKFTFFEALSNINVGLNFKEIVLVTGFSVPVGFFCVFLINYKILYRIAHLLRISNKFGDEDVWSYILNSKSTEWVVVRDIKNDLMYEGWIEAFSDSTEKDELFLRDVKVFKNSTAEELYEIPGLYLSRKREDLIMEFPLIKFTKYKERQKSKEGG